MSAAGRAVKTTLVVFIVFCLTGGRADASRVRGAPVRAKRAKALKRPLRTFRLTEGRNQSGFYQSARVAAHALVRRGSSPRILVATPAGNSGGALWFEPVPGVDEEGGLQLASRVSEVERDGVAGVSFAVTGPSQLEARRFRVGSVRDLRDESKRRFGGRRKIIKAALALLPARSPRPGVVLLRQRLKDWLEPTATADPRRPGVVVIERTSVGGVRHRVELIPQQGTIIEARNRRITVKSSTGGRTAFRVRMYIDRPPLTPLRKVLTRGGRGIQARNLGFLAYQEGLLAGSWQYLTPAFGRDSILTATLLADDAVPEAHGAILGSLLDRISATGRVSHEDSLGDQAVLERLPTFAGAVARGEVEANEATLTAIDAPNYAYSMIDGEYLLPHLVEQVADGPGDVSAATFSPDRIDALARVAVRIAEQTKRPGRRGLKGLVQLDPGRDAGNWRDSTIGLGGGRAPLDVNAFLVPAAMDSFARLLAHPQFPRDRFLAQVAAADRRAGQLYRSGLGRRAATWRRVVDRYRVDVTAAEARTRLGAYLDTLSPADRKALGRARTWSGVTVRDAIAGRTTAPELAGVSFPGIALDAAGATVPVMSTDVAFDLRYGAPTREQVLATVTQTFQPFPIGLYTPVGVVVANPAYSDRPGDAAAFGKKKYHGAVVWRMKQTMLRKGLARQLTRFAGDAEVEKVLRKAIGMMNGADRRTRAFRGSELWSWEGVGGAIRAMALDEGKSKDTNESNPVQAWSNAD